MMQLVKVLILCWDMEEGGRVLVARGGGAYAPCGSEVFVAV